MCADRCIVAADLKTYQILERSLGPRGPNLHQVQTGSEALQLAANSDADVLLVDDDLADMRGTDLIKRLRARPETRTVPVILVSSRDEEIDRVLAFELGVDDYVAKPFSPRELALRLQAVLRRSKGAANEVPGHIQLGVLKIDTAAHEVSVESEVVPMTLLEFRLLVDLARHQGRVRRRKELLEAVWRHPGSLETRTVDTHIKRLREKLGSVGSWIETVRGVGYRLQAR